MTNVSSRTVVLPANTSIGIRVSGGQLPDREGFVRVGSHKYEEWQKLVYEATSPIESDYQTVIQKLQLISRIQQYSNPGNPYSRTAEDIKAV
jgi:hypothetical protein